MKQNKSDPQKTKIMHYQITINFAEGVTLDTVALAKAVINNAIPAEIGGGKVTGIYVSDITEITPKQTLK